MGNLFSQLYPFVFVIGLAGYGPQLFRLYQNPDSAEGLSLSTWAIWASTWLISLGYGITKLHDPMFCLTAGMNFAAHIIIVGFILSYRLRHAGNIYPADTVLQPKYLPIRK